MTKISVIDPWQRNGRYYDYDKRNVSVVIFCIGLTKSWWRP